MNINNLTAVGRARRASLVLAPACVVVAFLMACGKDAGTAKATAREALASSKSGTVSVCALMPNGDVNAAIGSHYSVAEASDGPSESSCHYSSETDPAGMSLDLHWLRPSDYSSPAEHAALQQAGMGGAKLAGKLTGGMVPEAAAADGGPLHIRSGPVQGVGDEAMQNMLLLTARKGDYVLMVQITADPMSLMQDSTAGPRVLENERTLARSVFSKL
jgi:hypothetical protein